MTLPVSKYEELLETVRCLKRQTIRVRELASPLLDTIISANTISTASIDTDTNLSRQRDVELSRNRGVSALRYGSGRMEPLLVHCDSGGGGVGGCHTAADLPPPSSSSCSTSSDHYKDNAATSPCSGHSGGAPTSVTMWHSDPPLGDNQLQPDVTSVMSFASSSGAAPLDLVLNGSSSLRYNHQQQQQQQQLEVKVDMVYSLLAVLGTHECPDMSETLLALSANADSSRAMRQAGCLAVLVQLVYSRHEDDTTRDKAAKALRNLINGQPDERLRKREFKVLKLLEEIRMMTAGSGEHPVQATENIIKLSFDEAYRHTICELGGIYALAHLLEAEHAQHGPHADAEGCITLRRYTGMALTNLTFGHGRNKSLLCSFDGFLRCLVAQLGSNSDELRQVSASVVRNLSWRADQPSRVALRDAGAVPALMQASMKSRREATLKSVLSALWNLSAHCSTNKADICAVPGALAFLVDMLAYQKAVSPTSSPSASGPARTLAIVENAGGILRNVSSHIAVRDDYRAILREKGCLLLLLQQLKSPSLTVVSNACGTLWNLSAKCAEDQRILWDLGAAPMLRSLNHSKHAMIATGSRAALKNLLSSRPGQNPFNHMDATARELGLPALPTLGARKQRSLANDLDQPNLSETCDNIDPTSPPPRQEQNRPPNSLALDEAFANLSLSEHSPNSFRPMMRSKFSDTFDYEPDTIDQPIDYSRKYSETKIKHESNTDDSVTTTQTTTTITTTMKSSNKYDECGFEYEQDSLEQPIDYSRQYSERKIKSETTNTTNTIKKETTKVSLNKYNDLDYEQDTIEQPVDYSRKYSEKTTNCASVVTETTKSTTTQAATTKCSSTYNDYAETDLDQPTNYSLRYAEDDSDIDETNEKTNEEATNINRFYEGQQDTVKTYYTEGTPYETPYNFSTATSMSDLRIDGEAVDIEIPKKQQTRQLDCNNSVAQNAATAAPPIVGTNAFSSGVMTPEKPVKYCVEGTPQCFSRRSSISSLNLDDTGATANDSGLKQKDDREETTLTNAFESSSKDESETKIEADKEEAEAKPEPSLTNKNVTFANPIPNASTVQTADETPLMFSRCSSLGSLSSAEQHSIHDDRSSIISDFSRLTSGIVSPSELPDSPTQTVPPSPRHRKAPHIEFPKVKPKEQQQPSVFEDKVVKYKEVNTPVEFSAGTSLSSLTIDDDEPAVVLKYGQLSPETKEQLSVNEKKEPDTISKDTVECPAIIDDDDDEVDEQIENEMLAACINFGMPSKRGQDKKPQSNAIKHRSIPKSTIPTKCRPTTTTSAIPTPTTTPSRPVESRLPLPTTPKRKQNRANLTTNTSSNDINMDSTRTYCTEDTPAMLSHAGSHSDLSVLSFAVSEQPDKPTKSEQKAELSDNSSILSGDDDNILAECIQLGMPKARRCIPTSTPSNIRQRVLKNTSVNSLQTENKAELSGDSSNLSGDDDNILAECIQSGMPKAKLSIRQRVLKNANAFTPTPSSDEVARFAVEDSPCHFSLRSSLSDLTIDGATKPSLNNSCVTGVAAAAAAAAPQNEAGAAAAALSRVESLSSLSVESFGSMENAEQALLEQCISSGMPPKSRKNNVTDESKNGSVPSVATWRPIQSAAATGDRLTNAKTENNDTIDAGTNVANSSDEIRSPPPPLNTGCDEQQHSRMLDPDAMIESLDRYTAELVSHSLHLQQQYTYTEYNGEGGDTWNDDTSPNDVSFPSISVSAPLPLVASFRSDTTDDNPPSTMTDSTIRAIAAEATKICNDINNQPQMQSSVTSLDLENMKPPSIMDSLLSLTSSINSATMSPIAQRKKLMMRRALSISQQSSCNLDHVKPPSYFADMVDMENSMLSVASITSEVADPQQSNQNEENNDDDDATTEAFEDCFSSHAVDDTTIGTVTEYYSDANSGTPVPSDLSGSSTNVSAESTPKKLARPLNRMTPKQRRQLAKERYRTYTVAAEMVIREANNDCKNNNKFDENHLEEYSDYSHFTTATANSAPKLTPKERRQLDRSRFQTRVLDGAIPIPTNNADDFTDVGGGSSESAGNSPLLDQRMRRNRRLENRERFRTRTLSDTGGGDENGPSSIHDDNELHLVLAQQANIVLDTLHADELLDCETLSLVSNEDDSEHNSVSSVNYRTYHKSWGFSKHLPVIQGAQCVAAEPKLPVLPDLDQDQKLEQTESDLNKCAKPKIVKPGEERSNTTVQEQQQEKTIRGRRKPLYAGAPSVTKRPQVPVVSSTTSSTTNKLITRSIKPVRTMTSNLVKNVTSTLKTTSNLKASSKASPLQTTTPPQSRIAKPVNNKLKAPLTVFSASKLERQGTFTKEDNHKKSQSRIPTAGGGGMHSSASSQSLQNNKQRSSIPNLVQPQRSNSNMSLKSADKKPQIAVTSRIASLWKRSNTSPSVNGTRNDSTSAQNHKKLSSNTSSSSSSSITSTVQMRTKNNNTKNKTAANGKAPDNTSGKRLSRLGSFIQVEEISVT